MQLNILKRSALERLRSDIYDNIEKYSTDHLWIDEYFNEKSILNCNNKLDTLR